MVSTVYIGQKAAELQAGMAYQTPPPPALPFSSFVSCCPGAVLGGGLRAPDSGRTGVFRLVVKCVIFCCHALHCVLYTVPGYQLPAHVPVLYEAVGGIVEPEKMIQANILRAWYHGAHVKTGETVRPTGVVVGQQDAFTVWTHNAPPSLSCALCTIYQTTIY